MTSLLSLGLAAAAAAQGPGGLAVGVLPFEGPRDRCPSAVPIREETVLALDNSGEFASVRAVASRSDAAGVDVVVSVKINLAGFSMNPTVSAKTPGGRELFSGKAPSHMNAKCGLDAGMIAGFVSSSLAEGTEARKAAAAERAERPAPPAAAPAGGLTKADLAEAVKVALAASQPGPASPAPAAPQAPRSDVDAPSYRLAPDERKFAVIVGVEKYNTLPEARFAERDAAAVRAHAVALGFPERNVVLLTGAQATRTGLVKNVETWLARNVSESSTVLFYFSGHGAPEPTTGQAYLVPVDGDPAYLEDTGYPVKRLYERLGALKARQVLVALDSCFSGAGGRSVLAPGTRPLVVEVSAAPDRASPVAALTASAGNQVSGTLDEQGHGLFTYFFLRGLNGEAADAKGAVTAASLHEYLRPKVEDAARRANREQTPQLRSPSSSPLRLR